MDERRSRVREDLRGLIEGDLLFEEALRRSYADDASVWTIDPLGVVLPRTREDVERTVRYASEEGIPIHPRGAGTGLYGACLGPGLVLDFSRYLRRVLAVEPASVVVEAGAVLAEVNTRLVPTGQRLAPDPAEPTTCTIGGMIAADSAGPRSFRNGATSDVVDWLEVVLSTGERLRLGCEPWPASGLDNASEAAEPRPARMARRLTVLMRKHADLIARLQTYGPRRYAGYALDRAARPEGIDLARLVCGSEGTLALVTAARLRTEAIPGGQAVAVLGFGRLSDAIEAASMFVQAGVAACELLDWRRSALAREFDPSLKPTLNDATEASLVVLLEGDDSVRLLREVKSLATRLDSQRVLSGEPVVSSRRSDGERWLSLRRLVHPLMLQTAGASPPVALWGDIVIPPASIAELLRRATAVGREHDVNWTYHVHVGDGLIHLRPYLNLSAAIDRDKAEAFGLAIEQVVHRLGGTVEGRDGPARLPAELSALAEVFQEVKRLFDPIGVFNPARSWPADAAPAAVPAAGGVTRMGLEPKPYIPQDPAAGRLPVLNQPLRWPESSREKHIAACNDCGDCRTGDPNLRMCPTFRGLRFEPASPRSQVKLLRQIASGEMDPRTWGSDELKARADLCVHCRLCRNECPAEIDVSSLMLEAKAAYVENHGLSLGDWTLSRLDVWARWTNRLPILTRLLLESPRSRWWIERFTGLSRYRVMPRSRRRSFLSRATQLGLTEARPHEPGPRVAYFVDTFANSFDQELAESVVAVLRHAGVNVFVPRAQRGCGMPSLVVGDLDRARELLVANLRVLSSAVRDGYTIVCSEPTAALMFTQIALTLTDDLDAPLVAASIRDVGQYLEGLAARGGLPPATVPVHARVGYHEPCHLRALNVGTPGLNLIRAIPGIEVEHIDRGCSGMAGVYGMSRRNFRTSLRIGRGLRSRLADDDLEIGSTECGTCRMQMEQGLSKRTLHPIKLLAMAYGLKPELRREFKNPKPRHSIS